MKLNLNALIAYSILAVITALNLVGIKPTLSPGLSFAMGTALAFFAAFLSDRARDEWARTGWGYETVLRTTVMGLAAFFAWTCYLMAFYLAASGER
ncbi:MAG: hypothetical protein IM650_03395 [Phenylobacterium sp.]|uniref:hypothetical protein n=1 Tax=Phenylobacterium sp. TaxID=1871053 RepID=UPI0025E929AA|nr:hypothetical protein [Phenylobacterium sp.]MCA6230794.1 hypothetical protein [Phenylobacterium sp.]MCA6257130.1 hypothetical protein [Phenylobacterium sp.]MCA6265042.1 hypothetical protein [Phenylobacterium sp.]MCA6268003.1 hypothetical protein [Phenylobacterium sp.]MCA6274049.1 hypothetical protein [Phenylobacterium sp.]